MAQHAQHDSTTSPHLPTGLGEEFIYDAILAQFPDGQFINLARNENPLGFSPLVSEVLVEIPSAVLNRYPGGISIPLRRQIAVHLGEGLTEDNIVLTNGLTEVFNQIARNYLIPGDAMIIGEPTYGFYPAMTAARGADLIRLPLKDHRFDLEAMADAITPRTKVIMICNPNAPTGGIVRQREVDAFLKRVPDHVLVVFDEAYCDFVTDPDFPDLRGALKKRNILLGRTFSKGYGLAGVRVGYGIARAEIIAALHRTKLPFPVSSMSFLLASAALRDQAFLDHVRIYIAAERERVRAGLIALGLDVPPSQANFLFVELGRDSFTVADALLKHRIWVRHATPTALRVSLGRPEENNALIAALKNILRD